MPLSMGILVGVRGASVQPDECGSLSISLDLADEGVFSVVFSWKRELTV